MFPMQSAQFQLHAEIEQAHWWFVARRQIIRRIVSEMLPPATDAGILDVGCGTGGNIAELAGDYRCVGVDTSPEAIELASKRFPQVKFLCGTAPEVVLDCLPRIQLILLMDVLEHVADDLDLLSKLVLAATPGTYFLITVPADPKLWSGHDVAFGHYRRYEPDRLRRLWLDLPIRPVFISHFNSRLYPLVKLKRSISRRRGATGGLAGTDFRLPSRQINRALQRIFAGESRRLIGTLRRQCEGYRSGVSLIALLQRPFDERFSQEPLGAVEGQILSGTMLQQ
jgi:SAM-dependent methyltransferase